MWRIDTISIFVIVVVTILFIGLVKLIQKVRSPNHGIFDFKRDYDSASDNPEFEEMAGEDESTYLGKSNNNKNVWVKNNARHVFICGTTGSGKTIALSNFIKSGSTYGYPMLLVDGKGDTDSGSVLEITKKLCKNKKLYVINLNDPENSDKYNPFQNTNVDIIKDMLINMTNWSEEHYKYNTERYIARLCHLLELKKIDIAFDSLTEYLWTDAFVKLSLSLEKEKLITKAEHLENVELSKTSGKIAESASARFATIRDSALGQIFDASGIDIYSALKENAVILFVLNPLVYPEMSPLIGNLVVIDSKKAVSNFFSDKKSRIFYLLDEISSYANVSLLDLVNKSRSANVTCVLATQSISDLDKVSSEFKEQIIENCNNYIFLRQNSPVNANYLADVLGTRETMQATYQIREEAGEAKSTELGSLRKVHEYLYHPNEIKTLKIGNAIYLSRDEMVHTKVKIFKSF
ncbi:MAG: DUF853 family protein [Eubacteriaceae bacterium]|nr:DUF853 family protein [Eubacteriaceae bacterium]